MVEILSRVLAAQHQFSIAEIDGGQEMRKENGADATVQLLYPERL